VRPYPDAIFNGVYSFGVLHHTDHPEQAVSEMWRVMRPGATFMVALHHKHSMFAAEKAITSVQPRVGQAALLSIP
jgi:ubiquinone/menaquinone biosynthesis C-methylase UbiE